jgi:uncharacterized protein YukE
MKNVFWFAFLLALAACNTTKNLALEAKSVLKQNATVKSERGWKTERVTAEYWPKTYVGYSLKFTFPKNEFDSDRVEVSDTFEDFDCNVYEGGGSPGAPAYVSCDSVHDNVSADVKLKELIPALDNVLSRISLSSGAITKSKKTLAREAAEPTTVAEWIAKLNAKKEKCEGDGWQGGGTNGYNSWSAQCNNGVRVYSDTTKETQELEGRRNSHKAELAHALVSRCLSAKEFEEVTSYGYNLYTQNMVPFMEADMQSRFNAALQTQQILRTACPILTTSTLTSGRAPE